MVHIDFGAYLFFCSFCACLDMYMASCILNLHLGLFPADKLFFTISFFPLHFLTKPESILSLTQQNKEQRIHIRCVIGVLSVYFFIPLLP